MARWRSHFAGAAFVFLSALLGCGGETVTALPTQKIEGAVVQKNGKPFPGGTIEFRNAKDPSFGTMGKVTEDGAFTLNTIAGNRQTAGGIPEGDYTVTVTPTPNAKGETQPQTLTKPYAIRAGDTKITVTLEK